MRHPDSFKWNRISRVLKWRREGETLAWIAKELNLSNSRISQLEAVGLRNMFFKLDELSDLWPMTEWELDRADDLNRKFHWTMGETN
jgi:hypothetical protein